MWCCAVRCPCLPLFSRGFILSFNCLVSTPTLTNRTSNPTATLQYSFAHSTTVRELLSFYEFPGDDIEIVTGSALAATQDKNPEIGREAILKLMAAVESSIPTPVRDLEKPFLMPVEDTFSISGRGTVVTGRIETGKLSVGDDLEIVGLKAKTKTTCTGTYTSPLTFGNIALPCPALPPLLHVVVTSWVRNLGALLFGAAFPEDTGTVWEHLFRAARVPVHSTLFRGALEAAGEGGHSWLALAAPICSHIHHYHHHHHSC